MSHEDLQLLLLEAYYRKVTANRPSTDIAFRYFVFSFITSGLLISAYCLNCRGFTFKQGDLRPLSDEAKAQAPLCFFLLSTLAPET